MSWLQLIADRFVHALQAWLRRGYWFLNLAKARQGRFKSLEWPIICEGRGNIMLGSGASMGRLSELSAGKNSTLNLGPNSVLRGKATIKVGFDHHVIIGMDFKLEKGSRLFIQNDWVIGDRVQIATDCALFSRESPAAGALCIGSDTHIGDHTIIDVADDVSIGQSVAIGPNCVIYSHDHTYDSDAPAAWKGPLITQPVTIKDHAWIGSGVTILPGVNIGERAVIAAGSVVTKDVEPNSVYAGIPAKKIKDIPR